MASTISLQSGTGGNDGYCNDYKINLKLDAKVLLVTAEHRLTKQLHNNEFGDEVCGEMTGGLCTTKDQLYELLQDLLANKCEIKEDKVRQTLVAEIRENNKLQLRMNVVISFGKTESRKWDVSIPLNKVQFNDIERLERIIKDLCHRIEDLEYRVVPSSQAKILKNFKFQTPIAGTFTLSGNNETCTLPSQAHREISVDQPFNDVHDRFQKISFLFNTALAGNEYIGIMQGSSTNGQSAASMQTDNAWFLRAYNGTIFSKQLQYKAYTPYIPAKQGSIVSIILDTENMYLAFAVDNECDRWAFRLPKTVKPSELYALVILYSATDTVTIIQNE
ncbi:unnamed protein product [Didymodactylos carnosus]|uniref:B30.2/SPRY domain-containing protein n=1 Tax=Didymodactylos carnosus TaxID=1234261 RepID=A0A814R5Y6_9BILA|nr:unnamed protein product [Didymodactylos carnosus]CAF1377811.1 unnamed protein product [Didymodactylos carnosus]CAF3892645.1 unnamed protein product [Didymodactylos carnosus]CAF4186489.1 unnamed protein product [Didymodactylos carnosus]